MLKKLLIRYEWLILVGLTIAILGVLDESGIVSISGSIFWAIAGSGIATEAIFELYFDRKADLVNLKFEQERDEESFKDLARKMNEDPFQATITIQHSGIGITMSYVSFRALLMKEIKEGKE